MAVRIRSNAALLPLTGFLLISPALAGLAGEGVPIHIEADRAEIDEGAGAALYVGNVSVNQGTMRITADRIRIMTLDQEIVEIVATTEEDSARLAHYEQKPDAERDPVYADARRITYRVQEEAIELAGQAHLQQTTDTFSGELLRYDVRKGTVSLAGSSGEDTDKPGRISISLTPPRTTPEQPEE